MGTKIGDLFEPAECALEDFKGRAVAIDAYNAIYQFMASIRQPDGSPLSDRNGRPVSHLMGLFTRTAHLVEVGIRPVYIFDGKPHVLKARTLEARRNVKEKAKKEWEAAVAEGDMERARSMAMRTSRMTDEIAAQSRELLSRLGIPIVDAPGEGEAQASAMARSGAVWAASSQDMDSLLFGCPRLLRNLTTTGRRKLPRQSKYVDIVPELIELDPALRGLGLTLPQLVDLGILVGTDFNEGIHGIGPKKALALVREHGNLDAVMAAKGYIIPSHEEIRGIFNTPNVADVPPIVWGRPDADAVRKMLCDEFDFSPERVQGTLDRYAAATAQASQKRLDQWF